jgi:hypothetical protein
MFADVSEERVSAIYRVEQQTELNSKSSLSQALLNVDVKLLFIFRLLLSPEDKGNMLLRNIAKHPPDYMASFFVVIVMETSNITLYYFAASRASSEPTTLQLVYSAPQRSSYSLSHLYINIIAQFPYFQNIQVGLGQYHKACIFLYL